MFALLGTKGTNEKVCLGDTRRLSSTYLLTSPKALCNCHLRCCEVLRVSHLRLIPGRRDRAEALLGHWYWTSGPFDVLHCSLPDSRAQYRRRHRFHTIPETCFHWWHCHDLYFGLRMGHGME